MSKFGGNGVSYRLNFIVIIAAVFMVNLDLWVANVALPTIGTTLGPVSLANLSWVLDAYAIVLAALLITAGRMGDRLGNYKLFMGGITIFTVGSLLCAIAPNFSLLITGRVIQAAGAAAQLPASLALLMAASPQQRRHEAGRLWAAVGGVAAALGPAIGGLLIEASWRWIFLINVPIGLITLFAGARVLPRLPVRASEPRPDMLGAAVLAICIASLTGGLVQAPHWGWDSERTLVLFAVCVITGVLFGLRSASHSVPIIEGHVLRNRLFTIANLANLIFYAAFAVLLLSVTLWCQTVWSYSPLRTGFALSPAPLLVPFVAILTIPALRRFGAKPVCVLGAIIYAAAAIWMAATAGLEPAYVRELLPSLVLSGVGFAMAAATLLGTAAAALPVDRAATGSAVVNAGRQLGANFGVALLVTVFGTAAPLPSQILHLFKVCWLAGAGLALAAAVVCLWLPRAPHKTPAATTDQS